ncbi:hypothetical protein OEZ85_007701 [Tetradesmus obliquus]|uniref:Uncharacterized protein n=1 Tax=Tetradesmus obliquus TaxID=3088 RepID=A0ABY8TIN2_TETOB|nr:hypothetical protein OEZ85_007701 [Tetradesmus obliquus]
MLPSPAVQCDDIGAKRPEFALQAQFQSQPGIRHGGVHLATSCTALATHSRSSSSSSSHFITAPPQDHHNHSCSSITN